MQVHAQTIDNIIGYIDRMSYWENAHILEQNKKIN